jgi:hypothetical protein
VPDGHRLSRENLTGFWCKMADDNVIIIPQKWSIQKFGEKTGAIAGGAGNNFPPPDPPGHRSGWLAENMYPFVIE